MAYLIVLMTMLCATLSNSAFGEVEFQKLGYKDAKGHEYASLKLSGHILDSDVSLFKRYIKQIHKEHLRLEDDSVVLNSHGGMGIPAVAIGRIIRKERLSTLVPQDAICNSACAYVLISGVCRMALGEVKIHRSLHQGDEEMDRPVSVKENYKVIRKVIRDKFSFYREMGAPDAMVWQGINTPQWLITSLSEEDKDLYGLFYAIPEEQDLRYNRIARQRKVSKFDLVEILKDKYVDLNPEDSPSEITNRVSCSEQLFLSE